ncbi:hypothetical protein [Ramlibacter sp. WS9]|nr:hypothetical protein [Ramlibacter sp. WS9]
MQVFLRNASALDELKVKATLAFAFAMRDRKADLAAQHRIG